MVFKGMVMFVVRFKRLEKKLVLSHSLVSQKVRGDMSGADNVILTQQYTTILIWICTKLPIHGVCVFVINNHLKIRKRK